MRVGLLTTSYPRFDGDVAGCFVRGFARALVELGHEVEVLCPEPDAEARRPRDRGIAVVEVPYARPRAAQRTFYGSGAPENVHAAPWLALGVPAFAVALDRAVAARVRRWDALVSHWGLPSGLVAARHAGGRPHLAVFHSADVHLLGLLPARRRIAAKLLDGATAAWFVSAELKARFERRAGPLPPRLAVRVAPMGFDPPLAPTRSRHALRADLGLKGFTVLGLARLVPIKGLEDAVRAVARAPELTLVVAGEGPERPRLEALAAATGARARFVGHVEGERKRALLHAADAFVLSSVEARGRREGAPTALLEAMAAGLPVVATRTGGVPELVRDGEDGLLVPARSPDALAAALQRLARDPSRAEALGAAARRRAAAFAWPAQRGALAALLDR
jgi:glycosyltransferase involved in cell wall biosynthesis